ncbi:MAG: GTPase ObgE [Kiritimatiellae bacterium]|nr:GTPase ObgE [Kiritimatiellia bacterium]
MKSRRFVDCVTIHARAGRGGDGSASFRREAHVERGGPDGGDGGRGGSVILQGDRHEDSLLRLFYGPEVLAADGQPGRGQQMHGRNAPDLILNVPCGTSVFDADTDAQVCDILFHGQQVVLAAGGAGGRGNVHWKSATHQAPTEHTPGEAGQEFRLRLELKTIADAGLVGFPNAGKSSLLAAISDAHPKVGAYPFTTLNPVIGTAVYPDFSQIRIADIPGLVAGAHQGTGLGVDFLRHLARARVLIFVVDAAGADGRTPWEDLRVLRQELRAYDPALLKRPSLLVANKLDLPAAAANLARLEKSARRKAIAVSTVTGQGLPDLLARLKELIKPVAAGAVQPARPSRSARAPAAAPPDDSGQDLVTEDKLRHASFFDFGRDK